MARKLTPEEIKQALPNYPEWFYDEAQDVLYTAIEFQDFNRAVDFINVVRDLANAANHHPDISLFNFKYVQLYLRTHEANGVTDTDFELAKLVDDLFAGSVEQQAQAEAEAIQKVAPVVEQFVASNAQPPEPQPLVAHQNTPAPLNAQANPTAAPAIQPPAVPSVTPSPQSQQLAPQNSTPPVTVQQQQATQAPINAPEPNQAAATQLETEAQNQQDGIQQTNPAPPKPINPAARPVLPPKAPDQPQTGQ